MKCLHLGCEMEKQILRFYSLEISAKEFIEKGNSFVKCNRGAMKNKIRDWIPCLRLGTFEGTSTVEYQSEIHNFRY